MKRRKLDFSKINTAALPALPALCARWMPGGKRIGREYVTLNPTRADKRAGSFRRLIDAGKLNAVRLSERRRGILASELARYMSDIAA